jgi:pyruvate dehydrogenase E2 component (dihydrolipoamide acetyltransferase)
MSQEFKFTDPGEGLHEAEILEVHVSEGDQVEDGDTVLTVETDKASTEVPAPFTGTIQEMRVAEGDVVEVGDVLMTYDSGEEEGGGESEAQEEERESQERAESEQEESKQKESEQEQKSTAKREAGEPVPAAPSTRRLAREKGVDLHDIEPSGPHGRVTAEDVEAAAQVAEGQKQSKESRGREAAAGSVFIPSGSPPVSLPDFSQWGEIERMPLRSIRRATAQNMALSWGQIPHVYHQDIADVTELERFRRAHTEAAQAQGGKFTLTVLVMKALVSVLKQFPRFNASLDVENEEIVLKHYCHIGLAVATDHGLLVPVIRDVDKKNLVELTAEATDIAQRTRDGDIKGEEMRGASMTLTNPGPMGGASLTPLINHPQVAILGMAAARLQPTVEGDLDDYKIKPRLRLPLILGFDHRVNDGAEAAQFVTRLIRTLADPDSLALKI